MNKVTEYADTAYKGKADPYYRENIAGPNERKRHLAKGQCKLGVFPRVKITGICWDSQQFFGGGSDIKESVHDINHTLNIKPEQLRLALHSQSQNTKEVIVFFWNFLHLMILAVTPLYLTIALIFGGWSELFNNMDVLLISLGGILMSKYLYRLLHKFNLIPTGQYVIFNRKTGMVEIANDARTDYHHLPFEQFNAHHRTVHSERGAPSYGFTLLHYQQDLMFQNTDYPSVETALTHWELIKNFMDTSEPLADIPQFEHYRVFDPTTVAYDKKHGRPINFWRRVNKKFFKKVKNIAFDIVSDFPSKKADTLHEALQYGYKVPDIIYFPWREDVNISEELIIAKHNWFIRYFIRPLLF